jgi:hypothetical protein
MLVDNEAVLEKNFFHTYWLLYIAKMKLQLKPI